MKPCCLGQNIKARHKVDFLLIPLSFGIKTKAASMLLEYTKKSPFICKDYLWLIATTIGTTVPLVVASKEILLFE